MKKSNFLTLTVAVCLAVCHCAIAVAQIPYWENLGLYGGTAGQIAVDPADANHVFLAVGGGHEAYAYETHDKGANWTRLPFSGETAGTALYDVNNSATVYLGQHRSLDNGTSWSILTSLAAMSQTACVIAVKPGDSDTLFAAGNVEEVGHGYLYRSRDGGITWLDVTPPGVTTALTALSGTGIAFHPNDPQTMYLALSARIAEPGTDHGIYKSVDGGSAWTKVNDVQASSIIVHPLNPNLILATGGFMETTLRRSEDGGETWVTVLEEGATNLAMDGQAPDTVYITAHGGAKSEDFGQTWTDWQLVGQLLWPIEVIVSHFDSNEVFVGGSRGGFAVLAADLSSIEGRNTGIEELDVCSGRVGQDRNHVVVDHDLGVSVSFDGGETWTTVIGAGPGMAGIGLAATGDLCFETEDIVYHFGEGINISHDGGLTWQPAQGGIPGFADTSYTAVLESLDHPERILVGAFDWTSPNLESAGLFVSDSDWSSFAETPLIQGLVVDLVAETEVSYLARVPEADTLGLTARLMYAAVESSEDPADRGLYWSEDSGESWTLRGLEGGSVREIAVDVEDGRIVYAAYNDPPYPGSWEQLRRSDDGGLTWTDIYDPEWQGAPVICVAASRTKRGLVYAGVGDLSEGYIAESHNYGRTWKIVAGPIERLHVVLAGSLYAGMDGGFYKYDPPWLDTDGDGISDDDETRDLDPGTEEVDNPFDPEDPDSTGDDGDPNPDGVLDGLNDWDGDGVNNRTEFAFGYNPTDAESVPALPLTSALGLVAIAALLAGVGLFATIRRRHLEQWHS